MTPSRYFRIISEPAWFAADDLLALLQKGEPDTNFCNWLAAFRWQLFLLSPWCAAIRSRRMTSRPLVPPAQDGEGRSTLDRRSCPRTPTPA